MDQDQLSRLDEQLDGQDDDERGQDEMENDMDTEERRPNEMREYAESLMQKLVQSIYGLEGGELAKTVSRQLPPSFLNPAVSQHLQQQGK